MNKVKVIKRTRKQAYDRWLDALESGRYRRITGALRKKDATGRIKYCCLGVLCDLAAKDGGESWSTQNWDSTYEYAEYSGGLTPRMLKFMGLDTNDEQQLIDMNDDEQLTFNQIAKKIRQEIMPRAMKRN